MSMLSILMEYFSEIFWRDWRQWLKNKIRKKTCQVFNKAALLKFTVTGEKKNEKKYVTAFGFV